MNQLTPHDGNSAITLTDAQLALAAEVAIRVTAYTQATVFERWHRDIKPRTLDQHRRALACFADFLDSLGLGALDFWRNPNYLAILDATSGNVLQAFQDWMLYSEGYARNSINSYVTIVRAYAKRAQQAGIVTDANVILDMNAVVALKTKRQADNYYIFDDDEIAALCKPQDDTLLSLLKALNAAIALHHGLRASEMALLTVNSVTMQDGVPMLKFYRPKVDNHGLHELERPVWHLWQALREYHPQEFMLCYTRYPAEPERLSTQPRSPRHLTGLFIDQCEQVLGVTVGGLHHARHVCATRAARRGKTTQQLMDMFGWQSYSTASYYVASATVQNR